MFAYISDFGQLLILWMEDLIPKEFVSGLVPCIASDQAWTATQVSWLCPGCSFIASPPFFLLETFSPFPYSSLCLTSVTSETSSWSLLHSPQAAAYLPLNLVIDMLESGHDSIPCLWEDGEKDSTCMYKSFNLFSNLADRYYYYLHFIEEESEVENGQLTYPRSHSGWAVALGLEPGQLGFGAWALLDISGFVGVSQAPSTTSNSISPCILRGNIHTCIIQSITLVPFSRKKWYLKITGTLEPARSMSAPQLSLLSTDYVWGT
jgi:hypothetical protein